MSAEVKAQVFEPFFTTKEKGKGTGLGLAMVFGIIKQSGGEIEIESAPNQGTTFFIYLPQADTALEGDVGDVVPDVALRGSETVLLVEDEASIRRIGERTLRKNGYAVLSASNGEEALRVVERHGRPADLLVTDVVLPGMSGRDLSQLLSASSVAGRTLFISGYTDDAIVRHGVLEPGLAFLGKPFSPNELLRKVRAVLDGPAHQARA
jgi:two-component system, cell cycle sensor histidine kinase and response regulator CckA